MWEKIKPSPLNDSQTIPGVTNNLPELTEAEQGPPPKKKIKKPELNTEKDNGIVAENRVIDVSLPSPKITSTRDFSLLQNVTGFTADCLKLFIEKLTGLSWSQDGTVSIEGKTVEKSNITQLVQQTLNSELPLGEGGELFIKYLGKNGVPEFLIKNPQAIVIIKQMKLGIAPPGLAVSTKEPKKKWLTLK